MAFFSIDSKFFKFVSKAADVFVLNLLWILCSLPIITIGASTCAAFYVSLKMVDDEEGYIAKSFFKAFRDNFKQGTILWCISMPVIYLLFLAWQVCLKADDVNTLALIGCIVVTAVFASLSLYAYPLLARYENTLKNTVRNSFGIFMQYFGRSVLILALVALEVLIIMFNRWTQIAGILFGPEFIILTISGIAKKIFLKIENT